MRMRFGSTCEGSNEPTFWGGSFQKTVGAALFLVAVSGLLCSCVHTYCTRGCDSADEFDCGDDTEGARKQSKVGLKLSAEGLAGRKVAGGRTLAGVAVKGATYMVDAGIGVTLDGVSPAWGMSLGTSVRGDFGLNPVLMPSVKADFTNFRDGVGNSGYRPEWMVTGGIGFDWILVDKEYFQMFLSPSLNMGALQWDETYMKGAVEKTRTDEEFYVGAAVSVGVVTW